jgi:GTP-binding protein
MASPLRQTRFLLSETDHRRLPACDAEVVFVGRSNVGKSSLINALCDHAQLARVSRTPGRTRGINVFEAKPGRWLIDLPGYGFAVGALREREYWQTMISSYLRDRTTVSAVYLLIDAKIGPTALDVEMATWLARVGREMRFVATKADQVKPSIRNARRREVSFALGVHEDEVAWVSSTKKAGLDPLRAMIAAELGL